jgi:hypothetical protein
MNNPAIEDVAEGMRAGTVGAELAHDVAGTRQPGELVEAGSLTETTTKLVAKPRGWKRRRTARRAKLKSLAAAVAAAEELEGSLVVLHGIEAVHSPRGRSMPRRASKARAGARCLRGLLKEMGRIAQGETHPACT